LLKQEIHGQQLENAKLKKAAKLNTTEREHYQALRGQNDVLESIRISSQERQDLVALREQNQNFLKQDNVLRQIRLEQDQRTELQLLRNQAREVFGHACTFFPGSQ
jgi:hypothetical protein